MQAYEDSLLIYNSYKNSISLLKQTDDPHQWYQLEDTLSCGTACALRRLKLYNGTEYKPAMAYDRQGVGMALYFPAPEGVAEPMPACPVGKGDAHLCRSTAYSVIAHETKFIVNKKGGSAIPYVERVYFDADSKIIKVVKLDPVSFLPIKEPQPDRYYSSINL